VYSGMYSLSKKWVRWQPQALGAWAWTGAGASARASASRRAKAAADYWRAFAACGLREAKGGNLPRTWLRFANRQKGAGFLGSKHASHPINAMLNYAYVIEAGRLAKALAARGLSLQIGYLRSDKIGRNSLVWDAI
jgi:CRISP-associated protein Cas1